jgi:hypothetical protein
MGVAALTKKANNAAGVTESVAARFAKGLLFDISF